MNLNIIDKLINSVGNQVDKNVESEEERQAMLTRRLEIDTTSPFKLPQLIRPLLALWSALMYSGALIYCLYMDKVDGLQALGMTGGILMTIIGFYFNSRKAEKINAKRQQSEIKMNERKVDAALRIERVKAGLDEDPLNNREERRLRRQERKEAKK